MYYIVILYKRITQYLLILFLNIINKLKNSLAIIAITFDRLKYRIQLIIKFLNNINRNIYNFTNIFPYI